MEFKAATGPIISLDESSVLDIGHLLIAGVDLAPGRAIPDDGDSRIDHSLQGFLFTCGPDHIRHPEPIDQGGKKNYPLHGSFSSHPAEIVSLTMDKDAECTARVAVALADGGEALLERHWQIDGETGMVSLRDTVTNTGSISFPPMLMYHMNIGSKHLDDGTMLAGAMLEDSKTPWRFGKPDGDIICVSAGMGGWAELRLGPIAAIGGRMLQVRFRTDTLPYLQLWHNQTDPAKVIGIEPVSHRMEGRNALEARGELPLLAPGETRDYGLNFAFI